MSNFSDRDGIIWMDGAYVPWREANVHVLTHTLHYGVGVFEGVRAYQTPKGTAIFRLEDHTKRFFQSARIMGMKIPYTESELNRIQKAIIRKNNLSEAYLRPLAYYGTESIGIHAATLKTHITIAAWQWGAYLAKDAIEKGVSATISSFTRNHVNSTLGKAKNTGNYVNSVLALQEAIANGYQEAILLDHQGHLAEASSANLFLINRGVLYTPPLTSVLAGITRETILQLAAVDYGIPVQEAYMTRDDLYAADEAFLTGSAAEVSPLCSIDRRLVGTGQPGPITQKLQRAYFELVRGKSDRYQEYLTDV